VTLHTGSVAELAAGLASKKFSAVELARHYLARIEAANPTLNAFVTVTAERALADAAGADAARAAGQGGPLTGIPLVHKDIFCTDGIRTSCGSRMLDNFVAPYDAAVVERLRAAGTVMLGKTNMDEFAMGSSNETSYYGPVRNPWDPRKVPGGSSGGSAACVAARLAPVATGTDTGGSIRQPAALVGVSGIKPTYGRVSRHGMVAFASSLDQAGVLAPSAEDCAILLRAMAGFDPRDSTSINTPVPDYVAELGAPLAGLRIGIVKEFFERGLDPANGALVHAAIDTLRAGGATLADVSCPNLPLSVPTYYVVAPAECSSNMSRFDGVRFGYRCKAPRDLLDLYLRSRGEGFGAEVKRRIMTGTYVLSAGYYDAYYLQAQKVRTPAFDIGAKVDDPITMYLNDIYTIGANLAGVPAMSVPCGFIGDLPVGLQLIGPHFGESRILAAAHAYQRETDFHRRRPAAYA
jgi:aspartyl-tRNA(Asn)/glutamyl-tRNA(Gln) amidotransferase subunit A